MECLCGSSPFRPPHDRKCEFVSIHSTSWSVGIYGWMNVKDGERRIKPECDIRIRTELNLQSQPHGHGSDSDKLKVKG